nr:unnamed protein product [Callosobruchus analis]
MERSVCNVSATSIELHKLLTKFWEIEEQDTPEIWSEEETSCERIFQETTTRDSDGRFVVTLPLKMDGSSLGESRMQAERRFHSLECKFSRNESFKKDYVNFLREYQELGHMSEVTCDKDANPEYFMPHHGVLREESISTKLRVVFDASAPSSNGLSLNNLQLVGPVIQDDLMAILIRFRKHAYVVSADICKMYRQVLVQPQQRSLQKIVWREQPSDPLKTYVPNTVTYGQASASFLAIRYLSELANECESSNPQVASVIRHDFYVDDLLTGADTIDQATKIAQEVSRVLRRGCFELRKWHTNEPQILDNLEELGLVCEIIKFVQDERSKTLGLTWSCSGDYLSYNIESLLERSCTKRSILSMCARIFDPLGLLSPCVVMVKMLMQRLWEEKISWDQPVSNSIASRWNKFKNELTYLNDSCIPRRVICEDVKSIELHGFSDASEPAYGACLYVRTVNSLGQVSVKLLCAKSKVSPLKKLTIPRLELCGALLLARLFSKVIKSIGITFDKIFLRSDSMVVLAWINTSSHLLKTFVSNRVVEIQSLSAPRDWHHVPTDSNAADLISRDLYPSQIGQSSLWWNGPEYLMLDPQDWHSSYQEIKVLSELKTQEMALVSSLLTPSVTTHFPWDRFFSFSKLKRTMAFMLRFIDNCSKAKCDRVTGPLTASQLSQAVERLVRVSQRESFAVEYKDLLESKPLSSSSNLLKLNPYKKKHPMIIHCKHPFTKLLFVYEHLRLFHAGPQLLISSLRNQFWPVAARNLAMSTVRNCMRCFRFNAEAVQPIMGDLPRDKITPTSPFLNTGVDYAGPFTIRIRKGRGSKTEKCYVAVFVCFSTKAIHLELVSSLSSDAFLNCLRRFIARRGKPNKIYSDNGTNFVGAKRELTRFLNCNTIQFQRFCADDGIMWYFNSATITAFWWSLGGRSKGVQTSLKACFGRC